MKGVRVKKVIRSCLKSYILKLLFKTWLFHHDPMTSPTLYTLHLPAACLQLHRVFKNFSICHGGACLTCSVPAAWFHHACSCTWCLIILVNAIAFVRFRNSELTLILTYLRHITYGASLTYSVPAACLQRSQSV